MTRGSCDNWATNEETRRARSGLRAAYLPLQGDEPHRRGVHAPARTCVAPRARSAASTLGNARRAACVPSAAPWLERLGRAFQSDWRGVGRRTAAAGGEGADVRLLPERAHPAPAAARRSALGPVRRVLRGPPAPFWRPRGSRPAAELPQTTASPGWLI